MAIAEALKKGLAGSRGVRLARASIGTSRSNDVSGTAHWQLHELGVVVVTHGQLATELVNSAEMIVGDLPHFTAVSIGWHDDVDQAREEIGRAIERVARRRPGTDGEPAACSC